MKNLIVAIALILCIFGIFMIRLNYEASTIPEVEEWIYTTSYADVFFIPPYEVFINIDFSRPIKIRIISEDKQDTINVTWEIIEKVFGK